MYEWNVHFIAVLIIVLKNGFKHQKIDIQKEISCKNITVYRYRYL